MADRTFAQRLREAIDADPSITEAGLAVRAGLDNSTVRGLLSGKSNNPRFDTAMKICAALGTTVEEFMGMNSELGYSEIKRLYSELSDEERRFILAAIRGLLADSDRTANDAPSHYPARFPGSL